MSITLFGRTHPDTDDYWDGNWIQTSVRIMTGGFSGLANGDIRADELALFFHKFAALQESLVGTAELETMEGWFSVCASGDGRGHMEFRCVIRDQFNLGNTLDCTLSTDQTFTRTTFAELAHAVDEFPVIGKP